MSCSFYPIKLSYKKFNLGKHLIVNSTSGDLWYIIKIISSKYNRSIVVTMLTLYKGSSIYNNKKS